MKHSKLAAAAIAATMSVWAAWEAWDHTSEGHSGVLPTLHIAPAPRLDTAAAPQPPNAVTIERRQPATTTKPRTDDRTRVVQTGREPGASPQQALAAYYVLRTCLHHQQMEEARDALPEKDRGDLAAALNAQGKPCEGLPSVEPRERLALLEKAAAYGINGAAVSLFEEGPGAGVEGRPSDAALTAWRQRMEGLLRSAAYGNGDYTAMVHLAQLIDQYNPTEALKLMAAASFSRDLNRSPDMLYGLAATYKLPEHEAHRAINEGRQLAMQWGTAK